MKVDTMHCVSSRLFPAVVHFLVMSSMAIALVAATRSSALAQETNWVASDGEWLDPANWDNGVPAPTTGQATISNGGTARLAGPFDETYSHVRVSSFDTGADRLVLSDGAFMRTHSFAMFGTLQLSSNSRIRVASTMVVDGQVIIDGSSLSSGNLSEFSRGEILIRNGGGFSDGFGDLFFTKTRIGSAEFAVVDGAEARVAVNGAGSTFIPNFDLQIGNSTNNVFGFTNRGVVSLENGGELVALQNGDFAEGIVDIQRNGELHIGNGEQAGFVTTNLIRNNGLIRFNHVGSTDFSSRVVGSGLIVSENSGTTILSQLDDFHGTVQANSGQVVITGNMNEARTLRANGDGEIVYQNANISGGFLRGNGIHRLVEIGASHLDGATSFNNTTIEQDGDATLSNFTNGGTLNNHLNLTLDGFTNSVSGFLNVNASIVAVDVSSMGVIQVNNAGELQVDHSSLFAGGGSRTYINSGGSIVLTDMDSAFELSGGLLVNNGTLDGTLNVNFGGLAKGDGSFGAINVNDGGVFSPGNSPGLLNAESMSLYAGSSLEFEIRNASGLAGVDFDQIRLSGGLVLDGGDTYMSAITLDVYSLALDNSTGLASNFDSNRDYAFEFLIADGGITGFDPSQFRIDSTNFLNVPNSDRFYVSSNGSSLILNFSAVPEPSGMIWLAMSCIGLVLRRPSRSSNCRTVYDTEPPFRVQSDFCQWQK